MTYENDVNAAREKLVQAEGAMDEYVRGPEHDQEQVDRLVDAVSMARNNLIDQLAKLWPVR